MTILYFLWYRKMIFDTPAEDPNYNPPPEEERPGGFEWVEAEGARPDDAAEGQEEEPQGDGDPNAENGDHQHND